MGTVGVVYSALCWGGPLDGQMMTSSSTRLLAAVPATQRAAWFDAPSASSSLAYRTVDYVWREVCHPGLGWSGGAWLVSGDDLHEGWIVERLNFIVHLVRLLGG